MSKHHLIHTSCAKGINGDGGQTVFSHTHGFPKNIQMAMSGLYVYPRPRGMVLKEETVAKLPPIFTYRQISQDSCIIALNTMLTQDYRDGGRLGNYLCHIVVCRIKDLVVARPGGWKDVYPAEYFGGEPWGDPAKAAPPPGANSNQVPPLLPTPVLEPGSFIDEKVVQLFLSDESHSQSYLTMVAAMLQHKKDGKRVVICDTPENTRIWIAALHYALPRELALKVSFTTYEFSPQISESRICGVLPTGTDYSHEKTYANYIFDYQNGYIEPQDLVISDNLTMALQDVSSFGFDEDFRDFVIKNFDYPEADEDLYGGIYSLYTMFTKGPEELNIAAFKEATTIWSKYARDDKYGDLAAYLVANYKQLMQQNSEYSREMREYVLNSKTAAGRAYAKSLVIREIIELLDDINTTEEGFQKKLTWYRDMSRKNNINIFQELMAELTNNELDKILLGERSKQWKWTAAADFFINHVSENGLDNFSWKDSKGALSNEGRYIGHIISGQPDTETISAVMNLFIPNPLSLIDAANAITAFIRKRPDAESIKNRLWERITSHFADKYEGKAKGIYSGLIKFNQYDIAYDLYLEFLSRADSLGVAVKVFYDHITVAKDFSKYLLTHGENLCSAYYQVIRKICFTTRDKDYAKAALTLMLDHIREIKQPVVLPFLDELADYLVMDIPFGKLSRSNREYVKSLELFYYNNTGDKVLSAPLLQHVTAMILCEATTETKLGSLLQHILIYSGNRRISLENVHPLPEFMTQVAYGLITVAKDSEDLIKGYNLFAHSPSSAGCLVAALANRCIFEDNRNTGDYGYILFFLTFLFSLTEDGNEMFLAIAGEEFADVSDHLDDIEKAAAKAFGKNTPDWRVKWEAVKAGAKRKK